MASKLLKQTVSHYRILECLGEGGMGLVYKAEDLKLNRIVALKFLPQELSDERAKQRLILEARAAASLNHPRIATVYEVGESDDLSFIAMEYAEGESLARKIERGPLGIVEAIDIAMQVADALDAAHSRGIVHCDIKGSNILVAPNGSAKVLDFGLAKLNLNLARRQSGHADSTDTIAVAGTVSYMSPEQARGQSLDARTDVFSLGVALYEMVTGRRPYEGKHAEAIIQAILSDEAPPIASRIEDAPLELESIIRKALEKNRDARYQSARAMLSDLRNLKHHLEPGIAVSQAKGEQAVDTLTEASLHQSPASLIKDSRLPSRASLRKSLLLVAGISSALAAVLDIVILQPQGGPPVRGLLLLLIAAGCAVGYRAARLRALPATYAAPKGAAFRGLLPFQEADRDRFYGREADTHTLFDMIAHGEFRFGVLFGESGSGKTSLLRAGVLPKLWEAGFVPIYCRSYKDPMTTLLDECLRLSQLQRQEAELPSEYLKRVSEELCAGLAVICDQFEEFFINFKSAREREPFISFVAACYNDARLPVKFLFAMRSDFLYLISSELEGRIPEPLMSSRLYHLRNFDEEQAAEIIEKSAERAGLPFEQGLSRQVARDLASADKVLPSELQIVGERLQSKRIYTIPEYRRAGGKEPLVHSFLEDVIYASGDQESARLLLRSLISDEGTRLTLTLDEIARRTQLSGQTVRQILNLFASARLIREIQEDDPWRYELMHEYLIERINQITGRVMDATQRANRLLKQYLSNCAVDRRTRIPLGKLWFIRRYSDAQRGERERELLKKSLRLGLAKACAFSLLLASAAIVAAAALSVSEVWESIRLSDGHTAAVRRAVFSPDGRLLASCGEDAKVIVWDFARRKRIATFADHTDWVGAIAFSPDGKWLATGSEDKTIIVWDAARFEKVAVFTEHQSPIRSLAFSPDGRLLASMSDLNMILWNVGRWQKARELSARGVAHDSIFFSPDSRQIIISNSAQIWDVTTGKQIEALDPTWGGSGATISQDGSRAVTVDGAGNVNFIDLIRRKIISRQRAHHDNGRAAAFSPDGRLLATGAEIIILWDAATQTKLVRLEHTAIVWSVVFSPDGRWLVSTHADGSILIWSVQERERVANLNEHSGPVRAVAFSRDGKRIASASDDKSIIIWDAESGHKENVLIGHDTRVTGAGFLLDAGLLATCDLDTGARLWDTTSGQLRWKSENITNESPGSYCLATSPDGRFVATSQGVCETGEGHRVLDFSRGIFPNNPSSIYGVAFSPDGRRLACTTAYGIILLWEVDTWRLLDKLKVSDKQFISVSFSPDGKRLVTGEDEGSVRLWEAEPLSEVAIIGQHAARIKSVAFSPDGTQLVSASDDQTIALWDVRRRSLITRIGTHTAPVLSVAFSPDGKRIVSGEHDKSVRICARHRTLWGYRLD
jgi:WD40 repeat protein/serine/threonine protein kinase